MIIVVGDLHLNMRTGIPDYQYALQDLVEYACQVEASAIIFAGDTLDPFSARSLFCLQTELQKFSGQVYGILGQHDKETPSWLEIPGLRTRSLDRRVVEIDGMRFYGLNHCSRKKLLSGLEEVPREVDCLILHQLAREVCPWEGAWDVEGAEIKTALTILGDYHRPVSFRTAEGTAYYTGSVLPQSVDEFETHGTFLVLSDGEVRRQKLQTRGFYCIEWTERDEVAARIEQICEQPLYRDLPPLVRITCPSEVDEELLPLRDYPVKLEIRRITSSTPQQRQTGTTLKELISQYTENEAVRELVLGILQSSPQDAIAKFREQWDPQLLSLGALTYIRRRIQHDQKASS